LRISLDAEFLLEELLRIKKASQILGIARDSLTLHSKAIKRTPEKLISTT